MTGEVSVTEPRVPLATVSSQEGLFFLDRLEVGPGHQLESLAWSGPGAH